MDININLFAAWCGLIVSGYDIYDADDVEISNICNEIKEKLYDESLSGFFAFSKTDTVECNPWFPRASNLSVYSLFMDLQLNDYYTFLKSCGDTEHKNVRFREWIIQAKTRIENIKGNENFPDLYNDYREMINRRFLNINEQIENIEVRLESHGLSSDIKFVFVPNLLQSKYLVDYAVIGNRLYVISAHFNEEAAIHEYMHLVAKAKRELFREMLAKDSIDTYINVEEMKRSGYLTDDTVESQIHALEEQFVRDNTRKIIDLN